MTDAKVLRFDVESCVQGSPDGLWELCADDVPCGLCESGQDRRDFASDVEGNLKLAAGLPARASIEQVVVLIPGREGWRVVSVAALVGRLVCWATLDRRFGGKPCGAMRGLGDLWPPTLRCAPLCASTPGACPGVRGGQTVVHQFQIFNALADPVAAGSGSSSRRATRPPPLRLLPPSSLLRRWPPPPPPPRPLSPPARLQAPQPLQRASLAPLSPPRRPRRRTCPRKRQHRLLT